MGAASVVWWMVMVKRKRFLPMNRKAQVLILLGKLPLATAHVPICLLQGCPTLVPSQCFCVKWEQDVLTVPQWWRKKISHTWNPLQSAQNGWNHVSWINEWIGHWLLITNLIIWGFAFPLVVITSSVMALFYISDLSFYVGTWIHGSILQACYTNIPVLI